ncbi:GYF domain-containing protein [Pseudoxanthomonas sp. GM95]|uniref:GYF domain-containing protein n=1 Tax=Pseudoxanthomonas sp. GM95 TaxID=1881043 RepID=UPI00158767CF|nr:GYF domain-containing protein [Pseudoxanthomonas sp. GM95]
MTQWYTSNGGPPEGPLTTEAMVAEIRAGRLLPQHLAWREGWPQWQPIASCMAELGLAPTSIPPPPPPLPPRMATPIAAPQPARSRGLSGCAIVALVAAGLLVPIIGILAAIAIPAYQDYTRRAMVSQAIGAASPAKLHLQMSMIGQPAGQCPGNGQGALRAPEDYARQGLARITFGAMETGDCGMELVLRQPKQRALDGKRLWLTLEPGLSGGWTCRSELPDKYLPPSCRSHAD